MFDEDASEEDDPPPKKRAAAKGKKTASRAKGKGKKAASDDDEGEDEDEETQTQPQTNGRRKSSRRAASTYVLLWPFFLYLLITATGLRKPTGLTRTPREKTTKMSNLVVARVVGVADRLNHFLSHFSVLLRASF